MQATKILPGKWYVTKQGDGLCIDVSPRGVKLQLADGATAFLKPNEVQYEIAKGQEPTVVAEEPLKPMKKRVQPTELERCQAMCELLHQGLKSAVHHLENPAKPIAADALDDLRAILAKAEGEE